MAAIKDTGVIPIGYYCYSRNTDGTKVCPYWSNPKLSPDEQKSPGTNAAYDLNFDQSKWFAHCSFLEKDSDYNDSSFDERGNFIGSSIIWDQVKECGQNPEPPPTEKEIEASAKERDIVYKFLMAYNIPHVNVKVMSRDDGNQYVKVDRNFHRKPEKNLLVNQYAHILEDLINADLDLVNNLELGHSTSYRHPDSKNMDK